MPQNTVACRKGLGLLIKLLEDRICLDCRPLSASSDSLLAPTLNMQAQRPPILRGVEREGTGAGLRHQALPKGWPRVGAASPPKREPMVTPQTATYKGGKPASWLSMLSILCHFHDLLWKVLSAIEVIATAFSRHLHVGRCDTTIESRLARPCGTALKPPNVAGRTP
jgi:hypothetical protein